MTLQKAITANDYKTRNSATVFAPITPDSRDIGVVSNDIAVDNFDYEYTAGDAIAATAANNKISQHVTLNGEAYTIPVPAEVTSPRHVRIYPHDETTYVNFGAEADVSGIPITQYVGDYFPWKNGDELSMYSATSGSEVSITWLE